jgi:probable rRNA maturation factor
MAGSSPIPPPPAAAVALDLAFSADPDLEPGLLAAAGAWAGPPETAEAAWQGLLAGWLAALQDELPAQLTHGSYCLGLALVGDPEIAALNADWRGKAGPTDVLAFAAQDAAADGAPPLPPIAAEPLELGDIVIALPTAARQAGEHGHGLERELLFLASHGLLHLLGWDHPDGASLAAMLARQERLLAQPAGTG